MSFFFRRKCRIFVHFFQWILVECAGSAEDFLYFLKDRPGVNVVRDSPSHRRGSPERFRGQVCNRCVAALPLSEGCPPPPVPQGQGPMAGPCLLLPLLLLVFGLGPSPSAAESPCDEVPWRPRKSVLLVTSDLRPGHGSNCGPAGPAWLVGTVPLFIRGVGENMSSFLGSHPTQEAGGRRAPKPGGGLQFFRSFHNSTEIF